MRIVQIIDFFQPKVGYQETFLAREFQKKGHNAWVVTSDRYFPFPHYKKTYEKLLGPRFIGKGEYKEDGIHTVRLPAVEIPKTNLIFLRGLYETLQRLKPEIVFCHGVHSFTSYLVSLYKERIGYKLLYDSHASFFNTNLTNSLPKKLYHFVFQRIAVAKIKKESDAFFAIGDEEKEFLCRDFRMNPNAVPVIHLGVDTKLFSYSKNARVMMRDKMGIDQKEIIVIYAGKISPNKDIHILLRSLKQLSSDTIRVLLVGGGEKDYLNSLMDILPKKIIHVPFVPNTELPNYYSAGDFAVWPGDPSQSMIEALGCGLPLILPHSKGTTYLDESGAVIRFKRTDVSTLTASVRELSYNTKRRERMRINAQNYSRSRLSWKVLAQEALLLVQ